MRSADWVHHKLVTARVGRQEAHGHLCGLKFRERTGLTCGHSPHRLKTPSGTAPSPARSLQRPRSSHTADFMVLRICLNS